MFSDLNTLYVALWEETKPGILFSVQCCSGSILAKGKAAAIFMGSAARSPTAGEGYSPISLPPVTSLFEIPGSLVSGLRTFDQCHMRLT